RRRHTRFSRDWSSDVCSSDLGASPDVQVALAPQSVSEQADALAPVQDEQDEQVAPQSPSSTPASQLTEPVPAARGSEAAPKAVRSEERRGGREGMVCVPL